jgi:hypothetical protein
MLQNIIQRKITICRSSLNFTFYKTLPSEITISPLFWPCAMAAAKKQKWGSSNVFEIKKVQNKNSITYGRWGKMEDGWVFFSLGLGHALWYVVLPRRWFCTRPQLQLFQNRCYQYFSTLRELLENIVSGIETQDPLKTKQRTQTIMEEYWWD